MKAVDTVASVLVIVGGLNWLLVGLFEYDLVAELFGGADSTLARVVYVSRSRRTLDALGASLEANCSRRRRSLGRFHTLKHRPVKLRGGVFCFSAT